MHTIPWMLSSLAFLASPTRAGEILLVDPSGNGDFLEVRDAVLAASEGDTVLVRPGDYDGFELVGKGLSVVGLVPDSVSVRSIHVADLASGSQVLLAQIGIYGTSSLTPFDGCGLWASNCAGSIRVQGCGIEGGTGPGPRPGGWDAVLIEDCVDVVLSDCETEGGRVDGIPAGQCGAGLRATGSRVAIYDGELEGGQGQSPSQPETQADGGGDGASLVDTELFASGTVFSGGAGGVGHCTEIPGPGGDGVLLGPGALARFLDCELIPGNGGWDVCDPDGPPGSGVGFEGGVLELVPGVARIAEASAGVHVGAAVVVELRGVPGDVVELRAHFETGHLYVPDEHGVNTLAEPAPGPGLSDSRGTLSYPLPLDLESPTLGTIPFWGELTCLLPTLPAAEPGEAVTLHLQPVFHGQGGEVVLARPLSVNLWPCGYLAPDCDADGVPDPCETYAGREEDCDQNGVPDDCQPYVDCNHNGIFDVCEMTGGTAPDRNQNGVLDECEPGRVCYVDASAPEGGDGTSWSNALRKLELALASAGEPWSVTEEIWVAEGIYRVPGNLDGGFQLVPGVAHYGGFAGGESELSQRDPLMHSTVLSGDRLGNDEPDFGNTNDNSVRVLSLTGGPERTVVDGFEIQGGSGRTDGPSPTDGGGMRIAPTAGPCVVANCTFWLNVARNGGALATWTPTELVNCRFVHNGGPDTWWTELGSALFVRGALRAVNCEFVGNEGFGSTIEIAYSLDDPGEGTVAELIGCTIFHNRARDFMPGPTAAAVTASTIPGLPASLTVVDCVLWANRNTDGMSESAQILVEEIAHDVRYCDIQDISTFVHPTNLGLSPRFVDVYGPDGVSGTLDDDLRLAVDSPCIDAGRNAFLPPDVADLDQDGDTDERIPFDLGRLPRVVDDPDAPDTGSGVPPLVDLGAHERQGG